MTQDPSLALFYVADGPRLEEQSWLLAMSLKRAHDGDDRIRQIAYVGEAHRPEITDMTHAIYEVCGVELRTLPNPPKWKGGYPHGNKLVAARDDRGTTHSIFLDTDMACMGSLAEFMDLPPDTTAAAPEGRPTWGAGTDRWERAYAHFGMTVPTERVRLLRGRRHEFVPYFNAGFIAFPEARHPMDGKRFGEHWIETALDFDFGCAIANKRPWLDQITLPLTMKRFGYKTRVLDEMHNYSLSHRGNYSNIPDATILHYHRQRFLYPAPQWPGLRDMMRDMVPVPFHARLEDHIATIETSLQRFEEEQAAEKAAKEAEG
ncbi:hypothetical protein [Hasllibacter sp. MH4015]|uniref:hypothetical protein n=1 Tax=Hasllibacter sp. MH4015 TaxID=2854029 RepID=UPI001CD71C57|nr:hypothetical protein [Hasllibacter sp. MH4015]